MFIENQHKLYKRLLSNICVCNQRNCVIPRTSRTAFLYVFWLCTSFGLLVCAQVVFCFVLICEYIFLFPPHFKCVSFQIFECFFLKVKCVSLFHWFSGSGVEQSSKRGPDFAFLCQSEAKCFCKCSSFKNKKEETVDI